jgi:hypothetical protein
MKPITLLIVLSFLFMPAVHSVDFSETCADKKTFELRLVSVAKGCKKKELSLGVGAIPVSDFPKFDLDPIVKNRFLVAKKVAERDGIYLKITSGFRSIERQNFLFNQALKKYGSYQAAVRWVAPPEISHHPKGIAIDVNYPDQPQSAHWLEKNGWRYGLCRVFKNEWWHFEPTTSPGKKCPPMLKDASELLK